MKLSTLSVLSQGNYTYALKKILAEDGTTIGYEIKPIYYPFFYGFREVLDVDYFLLENGTVKVTIDINPSMRELFLGDDGSDNFIKRF